MLESFLKYKTIQTGAYMYIHSYNSYPKKVVERIYFFISNVVIFLKFINKIIYNPIFLINLLHSFPLHIDSKNKHLFES
jgi:hypothetical protein